MLWTVIPTISISSLVALPFIWYSILPIGSLLSFSTSVVWLSVGYVEKSLLGISPWYCCYSLDGWIPHLMSMLSSIYFNQITSNQSLLQQTYLFSSPYPVSIRFIASESTLLPILLFLSILAYLHFAVCVINDICGFLDIYCLSINPPKEPNPTGTTSAKQS